jgi:hypothetical protein
VPWAWATPVEQASNSSAGSVVVDCVFCGRATGSRAEVAATVVAFAVVIGRILGHIVRQFVPLLLFDLFFDLYRRTLPYSSLI